MEASQHRGYKRKLWPITTIQLMMTNCWKRELERVLGQFEDANQVGDDWMAKCPAHEDSKPTLSISLVEDRILLNCFAGCKTEDVMEAATKRELCGGFAQTTGQGDASPAPVTADVTEACPVTASLSLTTAENEQVESQPQSPFPPPVPISHLAQTVGSKLEWLWHGYIPDRSIVLLTALWKAGKTACCPTCSRRSLSSRPRSWGKRYPAGKGADHHARARRRLDRTDA